MIIKDIYQEHLLNLRKFSLMIHTFSFIHSHNYFTYTHTRNYFERKRKKNNSLTWQSHVFSLWEAIINFC